MSTPRIVEVRQNVLKKNDEIARALRDRFQRAGVYVVSLVSSPGAGKTTIINAIIRIYQRAGQRVLLAAPTGRAAKKMSEATGSEAKTIHRLLEFSPKNNGFRKNVLHCI